jgi:DNA-binding LacI/PurR family transcriptional regulator
VNHLYAPISNVSLNLLDLSSFFEKTVDKSAKPVYKEKELSRKYFQKEDTMGTAKGSTIYDVAKKAGVSISTVSRFLNKPQNLNEKTAAIVREAVRDLAYIPHGNTGSRDSRQIGRVGVLTPFFPAPSFVQRLQGISTALSKSGYEMIIYTVESPDQLNEYLHSVPFSKRLDGVIILSVHLNNSDTERLLRSGMQIVTVECDHPDFTSITIDNVEGGRVAARYLLAKGLYPCSYIGDGTQFSYSLHPSVYRYQGFAEELAKAGHALDSNFVAMGDGSPERAHALALDMLSAQRRPRSVFAFSDLQAVGVLKAATQLGLRVPNDIAVLGFDDIDIASYMDISTISQSLNESGRLAAELLLSRVQDPEKALQKVHLKVRLVERLTT